MRRIVSWALALVMVPILALVVTFALNNKIPMELNLWPFGLVLELPVYLGLFGAMIVGVVLGGLVAWFGQGQVRSSLRGQIYEGEVARRELKTEREKTEALKQELKALKTPTVTAPLTDITVVQETRTPQKRTG